MWLKVRNIPLMWLGPTPYCLGQIQLDHNHSRKIIPNQIWERLYGLKDPPENTTLQKAGKLPAILLQINGFKAFFR